MSKISDKLNENYDTLGNRKKKSVSSMMNGQVLQANSDGFTDVATVAEAARFAGLSEDQMRGYIKAGTVRRVRLPYRTYAIGVNVEDVRKLIVSLGTTISLPDAAKKLGVPYITAHGLISQGRLAAATIDGNQRIRVTMESLQNEIEFRKGRTSAEVASAARMATLRDKKRPNWAAVELLAGELKKKLDERRAARGN